MEELQYLTEKDMEYFEKLADVDEAVILRISPEELLSLDLSQFDNKLGNKQGQQPNLDEIKAWIKAHGAELRDKAMENQKIIEENRLLKKALGKEGQTDGEYKMPDTSREPSCKSYESAAIPKRNQINGNGNRKQTLISRIREVRLDKEQSEIINQAILEGLDDNQILVLMSDGMAVEKMRELLDVFISLKNQG
ncbi:MAG: hypothetical protein LUI07_05270 [Lachnospiraceae bacterium]|nr:hypothetical protein [Lachnospiraceae bacterium]